MENHFKSDVPMERNNFEKEDLSNKIINKFLKITMALVFFEI